MSKETILKELQELDLQIQVLQARKKELNPFSELNTLANKAFGEWSEDFILSKVPNLKKERGVGKDMYSEKLGKIEVKSTRNTSGITFNQIKPEYSDYHIFIIYDIENIDTIVYLVPNDALGTELTINRQHNYTGEGNCYTMASTKSNMEALKKYRVSWEELNAKA